MKRKIELSLLLTFYILLSYFTITDDPRSKLILLHTAFLALSAGVILFGNAYYLSLLLQRKEIKRFVSINLILLVVAYFVGALLSSAWMAVTGGYTFKISHLIHPASVLENLPFLFSITLISLIYTYIKFLIISERLAFLKRIALYISATVILLGLAFYTNYQIDVSYNGDEEIQFLDTKYKTLDEIVGLPQFKDKVVYVDLWYSSCSPCMNEFEHIAAFKEKLGNSNVAFLYLGRETSHPNSKQRWKNVIRKYKLTGWHFYMSKSMASRLWEDILAKQQGNNTGGYPRYILFDQNGEVISYDAKKPSEGIAALEQIKLLQNQPEYSTN